MARGCELRTNTASSASRSSLLSAPRALPFGFMLPVSTPQTAIVYGSGVVPITTMIRSGVIFDIAGAFLIILLLPLMVSVLGLGG